MQDIPVQEDVGKVIHTDSNNSVEIADLNVPSLNADSATGI